MKNPVKFINYDLWSKQEIYIQLLIAKQEMVFHNIFTYAKKYVNMGGYDSNIVLGMTCTI